MKRRLINSIIRESIRKVLREELDEIENVPTFEVFNKNISMTELDKILNSFVYDKNDNCVGRLSDLHFKYDTNSNSVSGENPMY